jgi:hypothetical protein
VNVSGNGTNVERKVCLPSTGSCREYTSPRSIDARAPVGDVSRARALRADFLPFHDHEGDAVCQGPVLVGTGGVKGDVRLELCRIGQADRHRRLLAQRVPQLHERLPVVRAVQEIGHLAQHPGRGHDAAAVLAGKFDRASLLHGVAAEQRQEVVGVGERDDHSFAFRLGVPYR